MALKPLKDRIVAVVEKPLEKTKSGILLGEAKEKPAYAVVESVGPEVKEIKKGDKIVYKEYSTTEIKIDEKDYDEDLGIVFESAVFDKIKPVYLGKIFHNEFDSRESLSLIVNMRHCNNIVIGFKKGGCQLRNIAEYQTAVGRKILRRKKFFYRTVRNLVNLYPMISKICCQCLGNRYKMIHCYIIDCS